MKHVLLASSCEAASAAVAVAVAMAITVSTHLLYEGLLLSTQAAEAAPRPAAAASGWHSNHEVQ
jgi:hypothetical protein